MRTSEGLLRSYGALALSLTLAGVLNPAGALPVGAALLALTLGARAVRGGGRSEAAGLPAWPHALLAMLAVAGALATPAQDCPDWYRGLGAAVAALALVLLAVHAAGTPSQRRAAVLTLLGARLLVLGAGIVAIPRPPIDVWQLGQHAVDHLLAGHNPYTTPTPDIYQGHFTLGHQALYPYAPLNLILSVPARVLLGDYRYGLWAALGGGVVLLRRAGRRLGADADVVDVASLALVLHPSSERLIIHGWTEPYLILLLGALLYFHARAPGGVLATLCALSLPLLKQYCAVPALLYLAMVRPRPRAVAAAVAVGVATMAPLLVWNARATIEGGLLFFVQRVQFRGDSISLPAALHAVLGWESGVGTALAVQVLVAAVLGVRLRHSGVGGYLAAAALALFAGLLVAPQAFMNYYFFVGAMLLGAAVALAPGADEPRVERPTMAAALSRTWAAGLLVAAVGITGMWIDFRSMCSYDARFARERLARGGAVLDSGPMTVSGSDSLFLCTVAHRLGPLRHDDALCICADTPAAEVEEGLRRRGYASVGCTLDHAPPATSDDRGACRHGHCHRFLPSARPQSEADR